MRSLIFTLVSLFAIAFAAQAGAESRYCAGGCDRYGNPVYYVPSPHDGRPALENNYLYPPGYRPAPRYRRVVRHRRTVRHRRYVRHGHYRRHHKRRYKKHRRYRKVHRHHRQYARPTFHNRTKYCRDEVEWTGHGHGIRRCVWVRNDLIHRYEARGYHRH